MTAAQRRVLAVCLAGGLTTMLDNSVLNIAVPALRSSLHADATEVQWLVAGYSLAFGLALIPGGRLGDERGRKPFFIAGIAVFFTAGLLASTAWMPQLLVLLRLLQGAGAGLVNSQMIGTIQDVFTGPERTRALGLYQVTCAVGIALGPPLGGALIATAGPDWGWRLAFLVSAPSGLATLLLAVRHLPPPRRSTGRTDLDPVGLLLVGAMTLTVMLPFIQPSSGTAKLLWALAACVLAGLFLLWQRRYASAGRRPLLHPALARSAPYALGTLVMMGQFGASLASGLVLVMFLQDGLGLSPLAAAAVTLPSALAMAGASAVAWRMVQRFGRHVAALGLALGVLALLLSGLAGRYAPAGWLPLLLAAGQFCSGAASGLSVSPNQAAVLRHAPAQAAGVAGGILQMSQRIAGAVAVSAISGIYLNGAGAAGSDSRTAYWHALLACTALVTLSLVLAVVTARRSPSPTGESPHPIARSAPPRTASDRAGA
ncbi:MFS transporter [Kitasatospora sp. GP82]|uniref:MFS transporter n=1 Tax=Kitasatospora sp. GP82 TaxID=3035089 RepID=UPI00247549DD|nr:MFS transporter [Kitasatospora sp. GP82]MDH6125074.1 MFS family permease [Kitasatospora sp. GP82]